MNTWKLVDHFSDRAEGLFGDNAVGVARITGYLRSDGREGVVVSHYIDHVVATNQPGQPMMYSVESQTLGWHVDDDVPLTPETVQMAKDIANTDYQEYDVLWYHTEESAQKAVDRLGKMDESDVFSHIESLRT